MRSGKTQLWCALEESFRQPVAIFHSLYSFKGQPQGSGFQVCVHPGDSCDPVLWWERTARKENGVRKIPQHSPLHVRDALHPEREAAGGRRGAVQTAHHPDRYGLPSPSGNRETPLPVRATLSPQHGGREKEPPEEIQKLLERKGPGSLAYIPASV